MRSSRALLLPLKLGVRRVIARPGAFALAGGGIMLAACALATVSAASLVVRDRAVASAIADLPPEDRAVEVTWVGPAGVAANRFEVLDGQVRAALEPLRVQPPFAVMLYREARLGRTLVRVGGVDGLARAVRLTGRLPQPCRPRRCEVVTVGAARTVPQAPGLTIVGRGSLRNGAAGAFFAGAGPGGRLRLAEGVDGLSRLPQLEFFFRTYGWIAPVASSGIRVWDLDDFRAGVARSRASLEARSLRYDVKAPLAALDEASTKARIAGRRLLLVGGQAVVLLLAFVLLAGARLRRGAEAAAARLEWSGASRLQIQLAALAEAAVVAVPATALGWVLGAVAALALAELTNTPAGPVLARSVVSSGALALAVAIAATATLVLFLGARAKPIRVGGATVSAADIAGVGALAAIAIAYLAGAADAESLASSAGTGVVLLLLPGLIALVAAVVLARLLLPALRLAERVAPRRWIWPRFAALSLARNPGTATVAVVFVALSVGLAVFAATYRSTLLRNEADRAAFQVPLDYDVRQDPTLLERPLATPPVGDAYAARFGAVPVVRRSGDATSVVGRVTVLGMPAASLRRLRWRDDFSGLSPDELASRIGGPPVTLRGAEIPAGARELRIPTTVRGDPVELGANIRAKNGNFLFLRLRPPRGGGAFVAARLPGAASGGSLVGLTVAFSSAEAFSAAHRATGPAPALDVFATGVLTLGRPRSVGPRGQRTLALDYRDWLGPDGTPAGSVSAGTLRVRYLLTQEQVFRLRPRQATDGAAIPVIASTSLARAAGGSAVLPVTVASTPINVRVAATASRFPSVAGDFVVADKDRLETALNAAAPGSALADEAWVQGSAGLVRQLEAAAPVPIRVASRRALEAELRADPLARGSLLVLAAAAATALALALLGLALILAIDLRDETGELFDLETQGVGPPQLRDHVRLRTLIVAFVGLVSGVAIGAVLTLAVLKALAVSANSTQPVPPLVLAPDWAALAIGLVAFLALTLAVAALLTRTAFRARAPVRAPEAV